MKYNDYVVKIQADWNTSIEFGKVDFYISIYNEDGRHIKDIKNTIFPDKIQELPKLVERYIKEDIEKIIKEYSQQNQLHYHRFKEIEDSDTLKLVEAASQHQDQLANLIFYHFGDTIYWITSERIYDFV